MSKKDQRKKSLKTRRRDQVRWLSSITSVLVIIIAVWLFWESSSENHDLTLILSLIHISEPTRPY